MLLLHHDADVCVINGEGRLPRDMTQQTSDNGREIIQLLRAAEQTENRRREMRMLTAARDGNFADLNALVSPPRNVMLHEKRPNNDIFVPIKLCSSRTIDIRRTSTAWIIREIRVCIAPLSVAIRRRPFCYSKMELIRAYGTIWVGSFTDHSRMTVHEMLYSHLSGSKLQVKPP